VELVALPAGACSAEDLPPFSKQHVIVRCLTIASHGEFRVRCDSLSAGNGCAKCAGDRGLFERSVYEALLERQEQLGFEVAHGHGHHRRGDMVHELGGRSFDVLFTVPGSVEDAPPRRIIVEVDGVSHHADMHGAGSHDVQVVCDVEKMAVAVRVGAKVVRVPVNLIRTRGASCAVDEVVAAARRVSAAGGEDVACIAFASAAYNASYDALIDRARGLGLRCLVWRE